jgi:hypothetical protein
MTVDFPDRTARHLLDSWREKLNQARSRFADEHTPEARAVYLKVLQVFADLVLRHQPPPDSK